MLGVLGALLFLIYLHDIFNFQNNSRFVGYANDIRIFYTVTDTDEINSTVNVTLGYLLDWSQKVN